MLAHILHAEPWATRPTHIKPILKLPHDRQAIQIVEVSLNDLILAFCNEARRRYRESCTE